MASASASASAAAASASASASAARALEQCLESYAAAVSDANEVDLSLALFKDQWTKAGLSKLHYSCPAGRDKADFLQCLFAAALGERSRLAARSSSPPHPPIHRPSLCPPR